MLYKNKNSLRTVPSGTPEPKVEAADEPPEGPNVVLSAVATYGIHVFIVLVVRKFAIQV